jgi:hypothetical protein
MIMKTIKLFASIIALSLSASAGLVPDTISLTWTRNDLTTAADTNSVYLSGVTYRMTNNLVCGATTATTQDLSGLTITLRVGDEGTNRVFAGSSPLGTNGLFNCDITFPPWTASQSASAIGQGGIQLTLTDTNANVSVTYKARKLFYVLNPLQ